MYAKEIYIYVCQKQGAKVFLNPQLRIMTTIVRKVFNCKHPAPRKETITLDFWLQLENFKYSGFENSPFFYSEKLNIQFIYDLNPCTSWTQGISFLYFIGHVHGYWIRARPGIFKTKVCLSGVHMRIISSSLTLNELPSKTDLWIFLRRLKCLVFT